MISPDKIGNRNIYVVSDPRTLTVVSVSMADLHDEMVHGITSNSLQHFRDLVHAAGIGDLERIIPKSMEVWGLCFRW